MLCLTSGAAWHVCHYVYLRLNLPARSHVAWAYEKAPLNLQSTLWLAPSLCSQWLCIYWVMFVSLRTQLSISKPYYYVFAICWVVWYNEVIRNRNLIFPCNSLHNHRRQDDSCAPCDRSHLCNVGCNSCL